jgi:hypothetical protein
VSDYDGVDFGAGGGMMDPFAPSADEIKRRNRLENIQVRLAILGSVLKAQTLDAYGNDIERALTAADQVHAWVNQDN